MHKVPFTSNLINLQVFNAYIYRMLALLGFMILLLASTSSFALTTIPNQCSAGVTPSVLTKVDYDNIITNYPNKGATIVGNSALNIKITKLSNPSNNTAISFSTTTVGNDSALNITQTLADTLRPPTAYTDITLSFTDNTTTEKVYLNSVALNAFDIDRSVAAKAPFSNFDDLIIVTGESRGGTIPGDFQSGLGGTNVVSINNGLRIDNENSFNCPAKNLGSLCQASIKFNEPVSSVTVRYTNADRLRPAYQSGRFSVTDPSTEQQIDIRLDSYCYTPPKLTVKKALAGTRVNDTESKRDQFEIKATGGLIATNSFTTTGTGATITDGSSSVLTLAENKSYIITERVMNKTVLGDIANYDATYACSNTTADSTIVLPTTTMTYDANTKTRSFTLANAKYGDNITCTITNTPKPYTFSGTVFNDNGGISSSEITRQDITSTFTGNTNYFNGIFDSSGSNTESGIGASGLQVRLTNCIGENGGTNITGTTAQNIPTPAPSGLLLGQYKFTVPASTISALSSQNVCVVQVEPSSWKDGTNVNDYSVDTTPNTREVTLVANTFDYKTESNGSRNLNFGEVQVYNTSLVLIKSQYVHSCNINANYNSTSGTPSQTPVFSIDPIKGIEPGKCIAYKIEAYNRGHVDLKDIQITDTLQTAPVKSIFVSPFPLGSPVALNRNTNTLPVDKIVSDKFDLVKPTGSSPTKATLYFNTKYGSVVNAQ